MRRKCKHPCKIVCWKFYNINFSCLDGSLQHNGWRLFVCSFQGAHCLQIIICVIHQIALHHCKHGRAGHLLSDTSSEQTNIQYVEWAVLGGRFTHIFSLFCVCLWWWWWWWWLVCLWDLRREMMLRLDEEECQYGFEVDDAMAQDWSPRNLYVIYTRKMMS